MRFFANGPNVPDELLTARDEGRLIIIAGAGVSRAKAGLPDFFGLLKTVMDDLRVDATDAARKLAQHATELEHATGVRGLVTADRIFGLLERHFDTPAITAAVAKALTPKGDADLSAHATVLEIARGIDRRVRLITTNFDLLFEACDGTLAKSAPPRLPDPNRFDELTGVIHLHGHVTPDYAGAAGDGFVLSSAEFGRAYLSEGWATEFVRSVLRKYCVLFLGYGADDPPVQYLLEALNRTAASSGEVYAFQAGTESEAQGIWRDRGVRAIAYDGSDSHKCLWSSLAAWADRAKNPKAWIDSVIQSARMGPEGLPQHVRGQVAHVVSTREGARQFAVADPPAPATWLCVFDSSVRFLKPGKVGGFGEEGIHFDPFDAYGLDSDSVPEPIKPDDTYAKRETPKGAWDAFLPMRLDLENLRSDAYAQLRGHWAGNVPRLPARIDYLGTWISKVADQPACLWWAAGQRALHPDLYSLIAIQFDRNQNPEAAEVRRGWRYLFEAWGTRANELRQDGFQLRRSTAHDGWSSASVREFGRLHAPFFKASRPWGGPRPPAQDTKRLREMIHLDVDYPRPSAEFVIPDDRLADVVREVRRTLEDAVTLENELGGYGLSDLPPFERDPELSESRTQLFGLPRVVMFFLSLTRNLIAKSPTSARREYLAWSIQEDALFARLRIWAAGQKTLLSSAEADAVLTGLNQAVFWGMRHQRDLLLSMTAAWPSMAEAARCRLRTRIWRGPSRWASETKEDYLHRRAYTILERAYWLRDHGIDLGPDFDKRAASLRAVVPTWTEKETVNAASSTEARSGWVKTDTSYAALLQVPLKDVIGEAVKLSRREHMVFVDHDPFSGLVAERPLLALSALRLDAKQRQNYPRWAWQKLLTSEGRTKDTPRLALLIARSVIRLQLEDAAAFAYAISAWFYVAADTLQATYPDTYSLLWDRILEILNYSETASASNVIRTANGPDWLTEAINAPVGKLADVLMADREVKEADANAGLPTTWKLRANHLLHLPRDGRRHAIVMFVTSLPRFYYVDPNWAESELLSAIDGKEEDASAFWDGFLWSAKLPQEALYHRLKKPLLSIAQHQGALSRKHANVLAGFLLAGWGSIGLSTRLVTDSEMHAALTASDDDFRSSVLWSLDRWSKERAEWEALKVSFLALWPREKAARSSTVSARLCDLAFDDPEHFAAIVDAILPVVVPLDENAHLFLRASNEDDGADVAARYPEKVLALLWAVLPEKVTAWPYGAPEMLERIVKAESDLKLDLRYIELQRRWNSR